ASNKYSVFLRTDPPGENMHRPHENPARVIGHHQPAALAEECGAMLGLAHRRGFNAGGWHPDLDCVRWFWFKEEFVKSAIASTGRGGGNRAKSTRWRYGRGRCLQARTRRLECPRPTEPTHRKNNPRRRAAADRRYAGIPRPAEA